MSIESYDFKKGKVIDSRRRRVIMSDFEQEDLDTMQAVLRDMRFQILGKEKELRPLMELVRKHKVGVLFLDVDGMEAELQPVLADLSRKSPDMTVVLVSSHVSKDLVLAAKAAGIHDILATPFRQETVRKILSSID